MISNVLQMRVPAKGEKDFLKRVKKELFDLGYMAKMGRPFFKELPTQDEPKFRKHIFLVQIVVNPDLKPDDEIYLMLKYPSFEIIELDI